MSCFTDFWNKHPALLYGLAFTFGIVLALGCVWALLPIALIGCSLFHSQRLILFSLLTLSAFCFLRFTTTLPPEEPISGTAHVHITAIKPYRAAFREGFTIQGTILSFIPDHSSQSITRNIPFSLRTGLARPKAHGDYVIQATLKYQKQLIVKKGSPWTPVPGSWSLAEWRYQNKDRVRRFISDRISHPKAATFLSGIATGLFNDNTLYAELSRFGLQHIMAISGFHFACVALILSFCLRFLFPEKKAAYIVVLLLTAYFVFLGASPSILRAWVMATLYFLGKILEKQPRALNSIGVALIVVLLIDPLSVTSIGFQFTFLVTVSILLFFQPLEATLRPLMKKRPLSHLVQMDPVNQHGYIIVNTIRQIIALTLSVQIAAVPLALFWFQKFPLMSLIYNAFFPFLASLSLFLLILGLGLLWIPPVAGLIHTVNSHFTERSLNLAYHLPMSFDVWLRTEEFSATFLMIYFCGLFGAGIYLKHLHQEALQVKQDLAYL